LFNRYIREILKISLTQTPTKIAYANPEQILSLFLNAIKTKNPDLNLSEYKAIIRVSLDSRQLEPFSVALCWTFLGLTKRDKTFPLTGQEPFIDLETRDLFPTQHWTSAIAISMFKGKENKEDIELNCSEVRIKDATYCFRL